MKQSVTCVLLVDDDKATSFFNKMVVSRHDSFDKVISVQSGHDALIYLKAVGEELETRPDLIFLDINMPVMNGWEFLSKFEKLDDKITSGIKVILLSTSSNPEDVQKSMQNYEVDVYFNKPLSFPLLTEILENHFSVSY